MKLKLCRAQTLERLATRGRRKRLKSVSDRQLVEAYFLRCEVLSAIAEMASRQIVQMGQAATAANQFFESVGVALPESTFSKN